MVLFDLVPFIVIENQSIIKNVIRKINLSLKKSIYNVMQNNVFDISMLQWIFN